MTLKEIVEEAYKKLAGDKFTPFNQNRYDYFVPDKFSWYPKVDKSDCMHMNCPSCRGTGIREFGGMCIHGISCPCKNCRTYS